ncbi:MAG: SGNH/GDSL hydrolase family protein [Lachnospiraceae bacterium]|nr:SGNH/GDSL hydrolase family protein [Lachnospiraceae bacterium]
MYRPDLTRLENCMRRAVRGDEITIGFLGGSITQGSLASREQNTYASRVFTWWEETFPKARFHYVNGGIGGTTSHYGVSRAVTDVLMYQPDFVVVDFSVNDAVEEDEPVENGEAAAPFGEKVSETALFRETYEGVVRKLLGWASAPAVLLLNNVYYDTGLNAQGYHNTVGEWYHVPCVSIKDTVYTRMKAGEYTREELTPDGLHPNDKGHALVAGEITAFLEQVKERLEASEYAGEIPVSGGTGQEPVRQSAGNVADETPVSAESGLVSELSAETALPAPMTTNAYENARRLTIREISPALAGFRADTREKTGHLDHFKNGWIGKKAGDAITFEVEASCIAVQYRKTIARPAVRAELVFDGNTKQKILLDGNFEEDWGDCLYLEPVLHHGEKTRHTVEIVIPETESEEDTEFYLMALIIA